MVDIVQLQIDERHLVVLLLVMLQYAELDDDELLVSHIEDEVVDYL